MEFPEPGLDLHLDLGVRGADDQVAHRTIPAPSSPQPSLRDGLRQDPALNLCHESPASQLRPMTARIRNTSRAIPSSPRPIPSTSAPRSEPYCSLLAAAALLALRLVQSPDVAPLRGSIIEEEATETPHPSRSLGCLHSSGAASRFPSGPWSNRRGPGACES